MEAILNIGQLDKGQHNNLVELVPALLYTLLGKQPGLQRPHVVPDMPEVGLPEVDETPLAGDTFTKDRKEGIRLYLFKIEEHKKVVVANSDIFGGCGLWREGQSGDHVDCVKDCLDHSKGDFVNNLSALLY